jgi:uncharacterized protein YlxW (UPF0749 family)
MKWKAFKSVNALIVSFVLAGLLIGILVAAQFQSSVAANSYLVDELNAQKELLTSFDEDRLNLKNRIADLRQKIEENRQKLALSADQAKLETLDQLKETLGLTKLRGPGVRLVLSEGKAEKADSNANLIHAADLRDLVNLLRTAKVAGLSINGQRLTPTSTINAIGSDILVNKVKVVAPFEINVVGDTELIANRLSDQQAFPDLYDRIKKKEVDFDVEKLDQVVLPIYDGDYLLKYAQNGQA